MPKLVSQEPLLSQSALPTGQAQAPAVSQPLAGRPSQSLNPAWQVYSQAPAAHAAALLGRAAQLLPQLPQLAKLVKLASQPLLPKLSQLAKPGAQASWQAPALQVGVPLLAAQTLPQAPQLLTLVRLASQPLAGLLSQSVKPLSQTAVQVPWAGLVH